MSILQAASTSGLLSNLQSGQNLPGNSAAAGLTDDSNNPIKLFQDYMKENPIQRMEDAWMSQPGISKAAFNAMTPAEKQKIIDEMKADIEKKLKQQMENAAGLVAGGASS